jgi:hypothetical protein
MCVSGAGRVGWEVDAGKIEAWSSHHAQNPKASSSTAVEKKVASCVLAGATRARTGLGALRGMGRKEGVRGLSICLVECVLGDGFEPLCPWSAQT